MANNRIYLVHEPSGHAVFLGKRMGWGWYGVPDNIKERIEKLFQMVETQEAAGDQDAFVIRDESFDGEMKDVMLNTSKELSK